MKEVKYSVLRYFPSRISGESINLGVLCSAEEECYRKFLHYRNWKRLKGFDDELNLDFVKLLFRQIEEDLKERQQDKNASFSIERYIKNFTGDFAFDRVQQLSYEELPEIIRQIEGIYLKFDLEKSRRLTKDEEKPFIEGVMNKNGIVFEKKAKVLGEMQDTVVYDYLIGKYGIKLLDLDNKDINRMFSTVKSWAWNCEHAKDIEPVIIINYSGDETSRFYSQAQTVLRILRDTSAQIYNMDEGIAFLERISAH